MLIDNIFYYCYNIIIMNEKIRQLAADAKLGGAQFEEGVRYYVGTEDNFNKFAELIVRECIDTVSDCSIEYCTRPQIVNELKEHFGIK